jgi:hypothetical protein
MQGKTVLHYAQKKGYTDISQILQEAMTERKA